MRYYAPWSLLPLFLPLAVNPQSLEATPNKLSSSSKSSDQKRGNLREPTKEEYLTVIDTVLSSSLVDEPVQPEDVEFILGDELDRQPGKAEGEDGGDKVIKSSQSYSAPQVRQAQKKETRRITIRKRTRHLDESHHELLPEQSSIEFDERELFLWPFHKKKKKDKKKKDKKKKKKKKKDLKPNKKSLIGGFGFSSSSSSSSKSKSKSSSSSSSSSSRNSGYGSRPASYRGSYGSYRGSYASHRGSYGSYRGSYGAYRGSASQRGSYGSGSAVGFQPFGSASRYASAGGGSVASVTGSKSGYKTGGSGASRTGSKSGYKTGGSVASDKGSKPSRSEKGSKRSRSERGSPVGSDKGSKSRKNDHKSHEGYRSFFSSSNPFSGDSNRRKLRVKNHPDDDHEDTSHRENMRYLRMRRPERMARAMAVYRRRRAIV
jgi:hypothetical protein